MVLLDHAGVKVTDLERAIAFYTGLFGFPIAERRRFENGTDAAGLKVGQSLIFLLYRPEFQTHDPEEPAGIDHFCLTFEAAEWEAIIAKIREEGIPTVGDIMQRGGATGFGPSLYIVDPDGNQIEVKRA
ncbi:MAG: VOC family protein [Deltaproteobacteria bacterium]|nr:VOC family protein [Deltaproteobacteria bacterium]MBI3075912.1 VOC family protein [Deltaproteobacteria bacterium]